MIATLLLLAQALAPAPTPTPTPAVAATTPLPGSMAALPVLQLLRRWRNDEALARFVRDETRAKRCAAARMTRLGYALDVDVAVLVAANGEARRLVPAAINCPAVEQYAAGLASRMVRGNVVAPGADGWYRLAIAFRWQP